MFEGAALYAAGAMTAPEHAEWEARLTDRASSEAQASAQFEPALLELIADFEPITPPSHLRTALLEAIALPRGFSFRFAKDGDYLPTPMPGITFRLLSLDEERNRVTCLLRLEPGAKLPEHSHSGFEECLLLEGTMFVGITRMNVGDFQRAEADSDHPEQWTDTGALLYLSAPGDLFL